MTNNAMSQAVARGIRRGIYLSATGDLSAIRARRKKIEETDYVTEAWNEVGRAMYEAMGQNPPQVMTNSRSSRKPNTGK